MIELPTYMINLNFPYLIALFVVLAGLLLLIKPLQWGLLMVWGAALGYSAWRYYLVPDSSFWFFAVSITAIAILGMTAERWAKSLPNTRWISPQALWGAAIGALIGILMFKGLVAPMVGIFLGAAISEYKRGFPEALKLGMAVFFAVLGYPGFRLMLGAVIASQFLMVSYRG